jgi:thiol-disulfide isomerase/thioredoxin
MKSEGFMKRREVLMAAPLVLTGLPALAVTATKPQLLEFWASWCPICKAMEPTVSALKKTWDKQVGIRIVDVDDPKNAPLMSKYKIFGTATFLLLDRIGKEVFRDSGQIPQAILEAEFKKVVQKSA